MFDNLSTAVMLFDKKLRLSCINTAGEDLLSISSRRVLGQSPQDIVPQNPTLADMISRTLNTGHPYTERGLVLTLVNGRNITVDCKVTPIIVRDKCKEIIVELIDADTVQRVLREENLNYLHDAARESLRGMAHEIKNPLGGIRGAAQLLERELTASNAALLEYTRIIIQETDRLRNFIDRMLTTDKSKDLSEVNIHELLEYVCSVLLAEYKDSFSLHRDYDPSLPTLQGDREHLIQAMLNVVRNAIQAINGIGNIWIRTRILRQVTLMKKINRLVIRVDIIDDGPGIPPEIEKSIFYPMITGRPEGTGLGLSIAQSIINAHNGIIEHERVDDKTIFSIYLPIEQNDE